MARHYYGKYWTTDYGRHYFIVLRFDSRSKRDNWVIDQLFRPGEVNRSMCDATTAIRKGFYDYETFVEKHPEAL